MTAALVPAAAGPLATALDETPIVLHEPEGQRGKAGLYSVSLLIHGGALAVLIFLASLAPVIEDQIIEVQLIKDKPDTPAPAPRALAERRALDYAPALQAVQPQIVNPRVIAAASPAISAEALQMDAVNSVAAPTQIQTSSTVVERVSALTSPIKARASAVDVSGSQGPVVRGPVKVDAPIGASVGPRKVEGATGTTMGTGSLAIGGGSSVREGKLSSRDVVGSPQGAPLVSVDTAVGEGFLKGPGGTGTGTGGTESEAGCYQRPEVKQYLASVEQRTLSRWNLPPGVEANQRVTLRFRLDVAGSASKVSLIRAENNALGVSAIDALKAAAPFPPMDDAVRCLARLPITATFSNPGAG